MDYTTLTDDDKLMLARDTLRGRESDHYRLTLMQHTSQANETHRQNLEREITAIKEEVSRLEQPEQPATAKKSTKKS